MHREQRAICIYCERGIEEGHPAPRIDHWKPLSGNHNQTLCWKNLHLSCPTPATCDDAKGQRPLKWGDADPDLPWPVDIAYEDMLGFTSRGEIYVRSDANLDSARRKALELAIDDRQDGDRKREAILNLNHPTLVADRASALVVGDPLPQFMSIRVAWLRKTIGKGR